MLEVLTVSLSLLAVFADRTVSETRNGVSLRSDLDPDDREEVFAIADDTTARARELLEGLGLRAKATRDLRLRIFRREADYEDWRRRTNDQSTLISSISYYNPQDHEVVAAWAGGSDTARGQLRRQVARHVLLQYATDPANWIEEGFAGWFEGLAVDPFGDAMDSVNGGYLEEVRLAIYAETYCPLFELMDLQDIDFYGFAGAKPSPWTRALLYAQSWSLVFYLLESEDEIARTFLRMVAQRLDTGRWNQREYKEVLAKLDPRWRAFLEGNGFRTLGELVRGAWSALKRNDTTEARGLALQALSIDAAHRSALRALARAAFLDEDFATAADTYERLAAQRDRDYDALISLARARLALLLREPQDKGAYDAAMAAARGASAAAPTGKAYEGLVVAADAAETFGSFNEALGIVRDVLRSKGVPSDVATGMVEREQRLVKRAIGR